jgi:hypothetical protein
MLGLAFAISSPRFAPLNVAKLFQQTGTCQQKDEKPIGQSNWPAPALVAIFLNGKHGKIN